MADEQKKITLKYIADADEALKTTMDIVNSMQEVRSSLEDMGANGKAALKVLADAWKIVVDQERNANLELDRMKEGLRETRNLMKRGVFDANEEEREGAIERLNALAVKAKLEPYGIVNQKDAEAALGEIEQAFANHHAKILAGYQVEKAAISAVYTEIADDINAKHRSVTEAIKAENQARAQAEREYLQVTRQGYGVMSERAQQYGKEIMDIRNKIVQTAKQTGQSWNQVGQAMQRAGGSVKQINQALGQLYGGVKQTSQQLKLFGINLGGIGNIAKIAFGGSLGIIAIRVLQDITRYLKEATMASYEFVKSMYQLSVGVRTLQRAGIDITFGEISSQIDELGTRFGIFTRQELVAGTAAFLTLVRDLDFTKEQILELQTSIATLAIVNGRAMDDVQRTVALALSSGYTEGLQRLGVSINKVNIAQRAMAMGFGEGYQQLTEHERALATLSLILERTALFGDDVLTYQDSLAGRLDASTAEMKDQQRVLGQELLPLWVGFKEVLADLMKLLANNPLSLFLRELKIYGIVVDAAIEKTEELLGVTGKLADDEGSRWDRFKDRLSAAVDNANVVIMPWKIFGKFSEMIDAVNNGLLWFVDIFREMERTEFRSVFEPIVLQLQRLADLYSDVSGALRNFSDVLDGMGIGIYADMLDDLADVWDKASDKIYATSLSILAFRKALDDSESAKERLSEFITLLERIYRVATGGEADILEEVVAPLGEDVSDESAKVQEAFEAMQEEIEDEKDKFDSKIKEMERDLIRDLADIDRDHLRDIVDIWREFLQDREDLWTRHKQKLADIETDYQYGVDDIQTKAAQDYEDAQRKAAQDIEDTNREAALRRLQLDEKHKLDMLKLERDYQEKLKRLREDFLMGMEDALRERDAKEALRLIRTYNLEKDRASRERSNREQELRENYEQELRELQRQTAEKQRQLQQELQNRLDAILQERDRELAELALRRDREIAEEKLDAERRREELNIERDRELTDEERDYQQRMADRKRRHQEQIDELQTQMGERLELFAQELQEDLKLSAEALEELDALLEEHFGEDGTVMGHVENAMEMMKSLASSVAAVLKTISKLQGLAKSLGGGGKTLDKEENKVKSLNNTPQGYAEGGTVVARTPTTVTFGEGGAEVATFTPLNKVGRDENKVFGGYLPSGMGGSKMTLEVLLENGLVARIVDDSLSQVADVIVESQRQR